MAAIAKVIWSRSPEVQEQLNEALTEAHANHEMSFRVKDPETGAYDKIKKVQSYGTVVPLPEAHFQQLVESTQPVMQALRQMLRGFYGRPNPTPKDLGLDALPADEQQRILGIMRDSIYFEPQLVDPGMKDYPFLGVAGFDAAVGNLDHPQPVFFEYNLGTPSGLSNNIQLLEVLREKDPELFRTFEKRLPKDETFTNLKRAIDSNAAAWTGRKEGISVTVGPGPGNGAHPDVASIAMYSGMPLVLPSDLYQDKNGDIRLNTGAGQQHPLVTGIYGRMEESYFLSDAKAGLPLRSPDHDNQALSKQLGVALEPWVIYRTKENAQGDVVDVVRDQRGQPALQELYESMGRDPSRPDQAPGSFLQAIKGRRLYYSGVGGRVVDDKRVFQAVSRYLAPAFAASAESPIARPPRTLDLEEYPEFYTSPRLDRFVVKEPDKSGGSGVYLLCNLTPAQRQEVVEKVKRAPAEYIVQEFAQPAVMTSVERTPEGQAIYGSLANDWRIFSFMDAQGQVLAGPNSLLLRAAKPYSASTNTSQGAGYGIGLVLSDRETAAKKDSVLPKAKLVKYVGVGRQHDLVQFAEQLRMVIEWSAPGANLLRNGRATFLAELQREVMDILGRDLSPYMSLARDFDAGVIDQATLHVGLLELRTQLFTHPNLIERVSRLLQAALVSPPAPVEAKKVAHNVEAGRKTPFVAFAQPIPVRVDEAEAGRLEKIELGAYRKIAEPEFQATIDELAKEGGELRAIRVRQPDGALLDDVASAYFRLDDAGRPIIGADLGQVRALAALAHEREHFRMWREVRDQLVAAGMNPKEAAFEALRRTNLPAQRVIGEQRSLAAELAHEVKKSPLNQGAVGPRGPLDEGYVARMVYPEFEGVRDALHRARWGGEAVPPAELEGMFEALVTKASQLRESTFKKRQAQANLFLRSPKEAERLAGHRELARAHAERARSLFDLIVDDRGEARLATDQTFDAMKQGLARALERAGLTNDADLARARQQLLGQQQ